MSPISCCACVSIACVQQQARLLPHHAGRLIQATKGQIQCNSLRYSVGCCPLTLLSARTPPAALCAPVCTDKTVFPKQDIVGWYCTGTQLQEQHMVVHRQVGPLLGCVGCSRLGALVTACISGSSTQKTVHSQPQVAADANQHYAVSVHLPPAAWCGCGACPAVLPRTLSRCLCCCCCCRCCLHTPLCAVVWPPHWVCGCVSLQMAHFNEGPVFLLLNPFIDHSRKDLPVDVYETGGEGWQKGGGGSG